MRQGEGTKSGVGGVTQVVDCNVLHGARVGTNKLQPRRPSLTS